MEQLATTSILALFETNKEQRSSFVNDILHQIEQGHISPLKVHLQVKAMEDIINQLTSTDEKKNKNVEAAKKYRGLLLEEAQKNGKTFTMYNAKFDIKETGTKYDYSVCNDPELVRLQTAAEEAKVALEARQAWLKNAPSSGFDQLDKVTGEVATIYPPTKTSTTSVSVSLK